MPIAALKWEELALRAQTDPEYLIETISALVASGIDDHDVSYTRLESLAGLAVDELMDKLEQNLESKNWLEASRLFESIKAVSLLDSAIFHSVASRARGIATPSLNGQIHAGIFENIQRKGLLAPLAIYEEKMLYDQQRSEFGISSKESVKKSAKPMQIAELVSGVVTVYVDKGLKIEGGRGYPNRVIGTAFQIDAQGYYLTNYHVIESEVDPEYEGYSKLSIRPSLNPEARIPAKVIGWNRDLDLALLQSQERADYTFSLVPRNEKLKGDRVYAIGSPIGLENSVSAGIISASGRRILARGEAIQIDAPVNPGSSGGPLVDESGNVVGVVFAGLSSFQGLNFALPLKWVQLLVPMLYDGGEVLLPWLGVRVAKTIDSNLEIVYTYPGTTGFTPGDRIVSIDGIPVSTMEEAQISISEKPLNSLACVTVLRKGENISLARKVKPSVFDPIKKALRMDSVENLFSGTMGLSIDHISGPRGTGGTYKVKRAWLAFPGDESGISEGDQLTLIRYNPDAKNGIFYFDMKVKAPMKGYLEKTMRIAVSMASDSFL